MISYEMTNVQLRLKAPENLN